MAYLDIVADRLEGLDDTPRSRRQRLIVDHPTVLGLAQRFDHTVHIVPALERVDAAIRQCNVTKAGRLIVNTPPQLGKSTTLRWACLWLLADNPDLRIAYVSYAASLARTSGRYVRQLIETHSDELGISVSRDHADASDWSIDGHRGGMVSVGIGGALTGRAVDLLIIDDPLRNAADAASATILQNQEDWWTHVGRTRLSPTASVILTQTRWAEGDLSGSRLAENWPLINIPAVSDTETPDALQRPPGTYLETVRGHTADDWDRTRADVGERVWAALYQGRPAPPEGSTFKRAWIDRNRVAAAPALDRVDVFVDPADNEGDGDEAGVIVMGKTGDHLYLLADYSGHMTKDQWFRRAYIAALRHDAHSVRYEQSLSGLNRAAARTWRDLLRESRIVAQLGECSETALDRAVDLVARDDADDDERGEIRANLRELWDYAPKVIHLPVTGIPTSKFIARGTKTYRAQLVSPLYETNRVHHVGQFPLLEFQLCTWIEGQDSPDRQDAVVAALDQLSRAGSANRLGRGETGMTIPDRLGLLTGGRR